MGFPSDQAFNEGEVLSESIGHLRLGLHGLVLNIGVV